MSHVDVEVVSSAARHPTLYDLPLGAFRVVLAVIVQRVPISLRVSPLQPSLASSDDFNDPFIVMRQEQKVR